MTTRRILMLLAAVVCLSLTGCAVPGSSSAGGPNKSTATATPTPSSTPEDPGRLIVTLDGVTYVHSGKRDEGPFTNSSRLITLLTEVAGAAPAVAKIDDLPGYSFNLTSYEWDGMKVIGDGNTGSVSITTPMINGVTVQTGQGLVVGSSRADVLAADGKAVAAPGDVGGPEYFSLDPRSAPGTDSLSNPGSVGIEFVLVVVDGGTVTELQSPNNDYSDI